MAEPPRELPREPLLVAVVPAAGTGARLGADIPKQYLPLDGVAMLQRTLERLLEVEAVAAVVVALAPDDAHFDQLPLAGDPRVRRVTGADTRAGSVSAALAALRQEFGAQTWALVHDAARPLVSAADIARLVDAVCAPALQSTSGASLREPIAGGLLAVRVSDTLKRETGGARWSELFETEDAALEVDATVPRDGLWQAQTPQLFRAGALADALKAALAARADVTDEASAMERAGKRCLLVEALDPNPKITRPGDLALAAALLQVTRMENH